MEVGVVVGRFQTSLLHEGHRELFHKAAENKDILLVFIGIPPITGTKHDPLDYVARHFMIENYLNDQEIIWMIQPVLDNSSNEDWVKELDKKIASVVKWQDKVTMYSGTSGFLSTYTSNGGKYPYVVLPEVNVEIDKGIYSREAIARQVPMGCETWRDGAIYSIMHQWDICMSTVDIAMIKTVANDKTHGPEQFVLVGKKPGEKLWRFPGGFADAIQAEDTCLEDTAKRELVEETGMTCEGKMQYVGSHLVDDWRWEKAQDKKVMTTLFLCEYSLGQPKAGDDLAEVIWLPLNQFTVSQMNHAHEPLMEMLLKHLQKGATGV